MAISFKVDARAIVAGVGFRERIGLNLVIWWMGKENPAIVFSPWSRLTVKL